MTEFNFKRAWCEMVCLQWEVLPANVRDLVYKVACCVPYGQSSNLDMDWVYRGRCMKGCYVVAWLRKIRGVGKNCLLQLLTIGAQSIGRAPDSDFEEYTNLDRFME